MKHIQIMGIQINGIRPRASILYTWRNLQKATRQNCIVKFYREQINEALAAKRFSLKWIFVCWNELRGSRRFRTSSKLNEDSRKLVVTRFFHSSFASKIRDSRKTRWSRLVVSVLRRRKHIPLAIMTSCAKIIHQCQRYVLSQMLTRSSVRVRRR